MLYVIFVWGATAAAASYISEGLKAALPFNENTGATVADLIENGQNGTTNGSFVWESGKLHHIVNSPEFGWTSIPRGDLLTGNWTVSLWFEADENGQSGAGRVLSAATGIGGTGPEWFFRSGKIAMRINNTGATWDVPLVGTRTNAGPPDHWALPTQAIEFSVLYHYVVTHNAIEQTVKIFQAAATAPDLELVFDGTYSGNYNITVSDIRLSHSHETANPRYVDSKYHQLMIYNRVLTEAEAEKNHDAGPQSLDPGPPIIDHGPPVLNTGVGISASGHFFTYKGKTKMILADSGTQCIMQNLNVDYRAWVDTLSMEGHAGAHIWAFVPPRQQIDGSKVESRWGYVYPGITPWARKTAGPNAYDGNKQWDLFTFDEGTDPDSHYWPRLRDLAQRLKDKDMMLGITVFFGWPKDAEDLNYHPLFNLNGGPALSREDITSIYSPGSEVHPELWDDSWPARKKTQWLWEKFALKLIQETAPYGNVWFDFRDEWSYSNDTNAEEHFRNFFMDRGQLWADRSNSANFRVTNAGVPPFGSTPAMKTEGGPYSHEDVRVEAWNRAMSGIHYLLHNDSRSPGIMAWDPIAANNSVTNPADDLGRKYVGLASRFLNEIVKNLNAMEPNDGLVNNGRCLSASGEEYIVYLPFGGTVTVELSQVDGLMNVAWYNPRTGEISETEAIIGDSLTSFKSPASGDWVLHLVKGEDLTSPKAPTGLRILSPN